MYPTSIGDRWGRNSVADSDSPVPPVSDELVALFKQAYLAEPVIDPAGDRTMVEAWGEAIRAGLAAVLAATPAAEPSGEWTIECSCGDIYAGGTDRAECERIVRRLRAEGHETHEQVARLINYSPVARIVTSAAVPAVDPEMIRLTVAKGTAEHLDACDCGYQPATRTDMGVHCGYSRCCIEHYLTRSARVDAGEDVPPSKQLDGSGFIPCAHHDEWSADALVALINSRRLCPIVFDADPPQAAAVPAVDESDRCPRCGSPRWVGWAPGPDMPTKRQCVPCGKVRDRPPAVDEPTPLCEACMHPVERHLGRWCRVPTGAVTAVGWKLICCCEHVDADEPTPQPEGQQR